MIQLSLRRIAEYFKREVKEEVKEEEVAVAVANEDGSVAKFNAPVNAFEDEDEEGRCIELVSSFAHSALAIYIVTVLHTQVHVVI